MRAIAKLIRTNKEKVQIDSNLEKYLRYGEIVKPVINCNGYFVTNTGRVFSGKYKIEYNTLRGEKYHCVIWKELKPRVINGYFAINITNDYGVRKTEYIHYLVYEAFEGWIDRSVLKIIHKDHNKLNNNLSNLALVLRKKDDYQAHRNYVYRENLRRNL